MKQLLIKLSDTHYVIVDDSVIKEGDCRVLIDKTSMFYGQFEKHLGSHECNDQWKKITHSFGKHLDGVDNRPLSEVEEFINGYSWKTEFDKSNLKFGAEQHSFYLGFKAHQELVKDKFLFTKEQLRFIYDTAIHSTLGELNHNEEFQRVVNFITNPSTQWDVKFNEQDKLELV
jgi:hypothetical protein